MSGWIAGIQNAIEYIEGHLTEEINIEDIAAEAFVSAFHFQRIFTALCILQAARLKLSRVYTGSVSAVMASNLITSLPITTCRGMKCLMAMKPV